MPHHLQFEQWVGFPLDRVFAFFADPENLPLIMPASLGTQLVRVNRIAPPPPEGVGDSEQLPTNAVGTGSTIVVSFRMFPFLPLRAQWLSRISEFEWNHHFSDVQDKGPFKSWHHRHQFIREVRDGIDGTLVTDVVSYEVGFGMLGELANRVFIAPQMRKTFAHRQQVAARLLS
ncbi:MAG: SRPBCC family protein [Candidatus Sulfotelmatobacter sp.]